MNPIISITSSALRHLVVTGLFYLVTVLRLPDEVKAQVTDSANFIVAGLMSIILWAITKYGSTITAKAKALIEEVIS